MNLDRIDYGILAALQKNARISNKDLAAENKISPSTCLERVRRLKSLGVIQRFYTEVEPTAVGISVQAMISIRLIKHAQVSFDHLRDELLQIPEVIAFYLLAGTEDILLHVAVKDVPHLRTLVSDQFMARADVAHVETSLIFDYARTEELPNYYHQ